jgi:tetratricopeptide (TPR) repeat protein
LRYTEEGSRKGIEYFEQAIAKDPHYALAYAAVAMAYTELGETGDLPPDKAYARAREAGAKALALDSGLGEAHCMLAYVKAVCDFDWVGAEQGFKRALELTPSSADTYDLYGRMCLALERNDEALAMEQRAQELDPLAHRAGLAGASLRGTIGPRVQRQGLVPLHVASRTPQIQSAPEEDEPGASSFMNSVSFIATYGSVLLRPNTSSGVVPSLVLV